MENGIAVITVPLTEWKELKSQMGSIAKSLLDIKNKGQKEFLSPKEAMEILKCSRNTLQSYIDKGFFNVTKMKSEKYSKVIIKRADIDFFIQSRA
ncbi:helix-turn-helix domain-containing protein [Flavobacterium sp. ALJ2]|uniref:helix-turn-helix domain-containing protein n=1 Tax=Flavobacterium sp. ALJ2 TaxID=2786960 RepID=UPI0018A1255E|nr:helix-turn-helix domain-containing protein [Flavobacterium sp. ALJ2]MBF7091124.1 helix-turn-helix domain-containing protein [Flavobacterium sp. ALJ2]